MEPKVGIVLVNYNTFDDTIECVRSLNNIVYDNKVIVIVDNCSTDNSFMKLKESNSDDFTLVKNSENNGWSGGNNVGIRECLKMNCEYILLLNNDTVVEANFLNLLVDYYQSNNNVGIVAPKIMYDEDRNKIWYVGGFINWHKFLAWNKGNKEIDRGQYNEIVETEYITGCAMLINKKIIEQCGMLPEEYFMYMEDVDYSIRVLSKGYKLIVLPESIIYHKVSASTGGEDSAFTIKWMTRNRWLFFNKYSINSKNNRYISFIHIALANIKNIVKYLIAFDLTRVKAMIDGIKAAYRL